MNQPGVNAGELCQAADSSRVLPLGWSESTKLCETAGIVLFMDGFAQLESSATAHDQSDLGRQVIDLYKKTGAAFLAQMRGSFALALWDAAAQRLILAVDPFATRPVYYWHEHRTIAFAPRLSAFARPEIPREIDPNAIYFYLNHSFIPGPFTIFRSIKRLEPGHRLIWEKGKVSIQPYWDMVYQEDHGAEEAAICEMVRGALDDSVRFHLQDLEAKQVATGAFLSGGIDSSTLVGLMSQATGRPVKSFSVGFDEARYNEIYYARIAAARFHAEAHECFVQPGQALEAMSHLGQEFDEPFGNSSAIPTHFCLKMARDAGIKVMFAGDGGDELFGGNERYATEKTFMLYRNIPSWVRRPIDALAPWLPQTYPWRKVRNYVQKANQPVADRVFAYQLYMRDHAAHYFTDEFRAAIDLDFPLDIPREHYRRSGNISPLNRLLYMDLKLAIADNDLFKVNRMAEPLGIEVRYPYLDKQVAAASGRVPARLKVKGWNKRYIFKKAYRNLLPDEILAKKKHGFGLPTGDWLRSDPGFRELARSLLLEPRSINRGYFKRQALEGLFAQHDAETSSYYGSHIWNLMMLELWHRNHMDRRP